MWTGLLLAKQCQSQSIRCWSMFDVDVWCPPVSSVPSVPPHLHLAVGQRPTMYPTGFWPQTHPACTCTWFQGWTKNRKQWTRYMSPLSVKRRQRKCWERAKVQFLVKIWRKQEVWKLVLLLDGASCVSLGNNFKANWSNKKSFLCAIQLLFASF